MINSYSSRSSSIFSIHLSRILETRDRSYRDRGGRLTTRLIDCCARIIRATAGISGDESSHGSEKKGATRARFTAPLRSPDCSKRGKGGGWVENKDGTGWIRHLHTSILNKQWLPGIPFPRRTTQSRLRSHWKRVINATVLSRYRNDALVTIREIHRLDRSSNERERERGREISCEFSSRPDFYHGNSNRGWKLYIRFLPLGERIVKCSEYT